MHSNGGKQSTHTSLHPQYSNLTQQRKNVTVRTPYGMQTTQLKDLKHTHTHTHIHLRKGYKKKKNKPDNNNNNNKILADLR